ncbi:UNVERIFIED_CONTAM: hypothetical protein NCL1_38871 [Trichonephila clavipes]
MPAMHLTEHIGMAFTPWVAYMENTSYVLHPGTLSLSRVMEFSSKMGIVLRSVRAILTILRSFRTELLAIEALKFCFTESVNTDIWKLSDSQSSIQPLAEWWRHGDRTTTSIVQILNCLSVYVKIFFQWVPSHVNVCGIEIADALAREDSHKDSTHSGCLTSEIYNWLKQDISFSWRQAPVHEWYEGNRPEPPLVQES